MAAAAIPLVLGLAPQLIDLIAGLVHKKAPVVEAQLGGGTGPVKFADVFGYVMTALQSAAAAGQIPKDLPSDEAVKMVIQSVVTSLKLQGLLTSDAVPVAPATPTNAVVLTAGQTLTVTVR